MTSFQTRSHALPPSRASSPCSPAAEPCRGGALYPSDPSAAPAFIDPRELQAEWDRAGTIRRLRLLMAHPVTGPDLRWLPVLLPAVVLAGALLAAAVN